MVALRTARCDAGILFVTPESDEHGRLAALDEGIDEALPACRAATELVARVRLLLRDGMWIHLRPKEARLLELFARAPGRVLTRNQILDRVWGPNHDGDPRTVDVHVRWLRSKIEPDPHDPVRLLTVRGVATGWSDPLTER